MTNDDDKNPYASARVPPVVIPGSDNPFADRVTPRSNPRWVSGEGLELVAPLISHWLKDKYVYVRHGDESTTVYRRWWGKRTKNQHYLYASGGKMPIENHAPLLEQIGKGKLSKGYYLWDAVDLNHPALQPMALPEDAADRLRQIHEQLKPHLETFREIISKNFSKPRPDTGQPIGDGHLLARRMDSVERYMDWLTRAADPAGQKSFVQATEKPKIYSADVLEYELLPYGRDSGGMVSYYVDSSSYGRYAPPEDMVSLHKALSAMQGILGQNQGFLANAFYHALYRQAEQGLQQGKTR